MLLQTVTKIKTFSAQRRLEDVQPSTDNNFSARVCLNVSVVSGARRVNCPCETHAGACTVFRNAI